MQPSTRPSTNAFPNYDRYATVELLRAYAAAPARLADVLRGLDEEALRSRARGPNTWSIQEIVLHLTDAEILLACRVRKAWAEPGGPLPGYDESVWTRELDHQRADPDARALGIELFTTLRRSTLTLFERAETADWDRVHGAHPEWGRMTLRNLLELSADHGERHIGQILAIREQMGQSLEYPLLLPIRLF